MQIETTRGMIEESELRKEELEEKTPCGSSLETKYYLNDELVRSDVLIRVEKGILSEAFSGIFTHEENLPINEFISKVYSMMTQDFAVRIGEKILEQYPYLKGMKFAFDLPGFKVEIDPSK